VPQRPVVRHTAANVASTEAGPPGASSGAVPDVVAPPPRHPRFPLFDGLRAIAVISVVLVHVAVFGGALQSSITGRLLAHLNIGVAIFFLISGFLLYRPFIAYRGGGAAPPKFVQYAKRRALRIYPAYWLVLTVLTIIPGLTGVFSGNWWAQYGLLHALPIQNGPGCVQAILDCGLAQTWSLVIEMTFYAALPLYVVVADRLARGRSVQSWMRAELLLLAVAAAISVLARFALLHGDALAWTGGSVAGFVFWFALGMGLAIASVGLEHRRTQPGLIRLVVSRPLVPWAAALAGYVALSLWLPATPFNNTNGRQLVTHLSFGVIAALLLLPAVFGDRSGGLPRRVLANPVVAWIGLISYGIFLWHYVAAVQLGSGGADLGFGFVLAGTLAISIPCAAISYYLVERPLLRLKYRRVQDVIRGYRRPASAPSPAGR
jgi:peptidoglycan/LPS O-acetylase OafA/YrhL